MPLIDPVEVSDLTDDEREQLATLIYNALPSIPSTPADCLPALDAILESLSRVNPCPECAEGTLQDLGRQRNPAADQVECSVCGFRS